MNKERSAKIELNFPLELADRTLTELIMRRPTAGEEIDNAPTSSNIRKQMEEEAKYFAILCGIKLDEIRGLDTSDYDKLQQQYLAFRGHERS